MSEMATTDLRGLKNLAAFSAAELEKLAANLSVKSFDKDAVVFDQEEEAKCIHLLISGVVRLSYINSQERQTIVSLLPAGEFFGLESLKPESRHSFRCEALGRSTVGRIEPKVFVEMFLGAPYDIFLRWYTAAIHPGNNFYLHCIKGIGLDVRRRLALELLNLGNRFGTTDPRGISIGLSISHEGLAAIVGASRQQVTEYLNDFDREQAIFREGRRIILNVEKLAHLLQRMAE